MYNKPPQYIFGFHGCDRAVGEAVLHGNEELRKSENDFDWLGNGVYFWESNAERAMSYAVSVANRPFAKNQRIQEPFVIGSIIDLGHCLNLIDEKNLNFLQKAFGSLQTNAQIEQHKLPENKNVKGNQDRLIRKLDCAVIEYAHKANVKQNIKPFDSVRGVFWEGPALYPTAGFRIQNHIQICVRNPNCIKGYFLPRHLNPEFQVA